MKSNQRGVALLVVLLILALMTAVAATMSERLFSQFKRSSNQLNYQQAYWYSIGAEALAIEAIEQSYKDTDTVNLSQPWALEEQVYPLDYGSLSGRILDRQACFNLNALADLDGASGTDTAPYLVSVLQDLLLSLEVDSHVAEVVAHSSWEFMDSNTTVNSVAGVEDSYYESMVPAYMTANGVIADESELRAVNQVSGEVMTELQPYVCALPTTEFRLNVNTLSADHAALLEAMFDQTLSESDAQSVLENRPFDGWSDVDQFLAESQIAALSDEVKKRAKGYLTVDSAYFELDARVIVGESQVRIRSLLFSANRETATVISRRFGGIGERVPNRSTEQ
ncbi:type II secretion system minor pseudopilin GspK [Vibrio renipiscarius]|uniref:Type II secretion system protein K n=1 Tax=Vibrio renipiscarius TaxID=1461322 RepID=A0A0C2JT71_9VIBR|nr:type II secretion system minor pseudopilin GspK [Vibrio renipiscarius]KII81239.1 general secretion pathway protein GspK [Vibrio renipiscarius]KII81656.1 general secretion pathway protein GspK [Vibrio renipiscarius]